MVRYKDSKLRKTSSSTVDCRAERADLAERLRYSQIHRFILRELPNGHAKTMLLKTIIDFFVPTRSENELFTFAMEPFRLRHLSQESVSFQCV